MEIRDDLTRALPEPTSDGGSFPIFSTVSASALSMRADFSVAAGPAIRARAIQRSLSLGLTGSKSDYKLALRVQRQALLRSHLVDHITKQAKNEVDIRFVGRIQKRAAQPALPWHRCQCRPHLIGSSAGHVAVTAGTLGAFVREPGSEQLYALSNNHVFANEDRAAAGDGLLQPGRSDGGTSPNDVFASLAAPRGVVKLEAQGRNLVDAALGALGMPCNIDAGLLQGIARGVNRRLAGVGPEFVDEGTPVYKIGRTTGVTEGRVTAFELDDLIVSYDVGNLRFDNQIEIEGVEEGRPFSDGGDSGALIVDANMEAIGLLFAGTETGGKRGLGLTYANPIHTILTELDVQLVY